MECYCSHRVLYHLATAPGEVLVGSVNHTHTQLIRGMEGSAKIVRGVAMESRPKDSGRTHHTSYVRETGGTSLK